MRKGDKIHKNQTNKKGRLYIFLIRDRTTYGRGIAKLVADAFLSGKGYVKHKDGNSGNCALDNIQRKGTGKTVPPKKLIRELNALPRYSFKFGQLDEASDGEYVSRNELMIILEKFSK